MARPQAFERELKVATAGLEPKAISALLAKTARQALAEAQQSGEAPATYVKTVNGRVGAPEESVIAPGPIVYTFSSLPEVAVYALAFCKERSPVKSGRYKKSWFVMVNGQEVTIPDVGGAFIDSGDFIIPPDAELIITNDQPYSRKIETGHMTMSVPPGIVEDARQAVMRRFGNAILAQKRFISLAGAYALRTSRSRRKDRQAGRELTYPALVVTMRF